VSIRREFATSDAGQWGQAVAATHGAHGMIGFCAVTLFVPWASASMALCILGAVYAVKELLDLTAGRWKLPVVLDSVLDWCIVMIGGIMALGGDIRAFAVTMLGLMAFAGLFGIWRGRSRE
jgi:hypothetical protein